MSLKIIWGDITKEKTDALVTLASREARVGSGVDKSVHAAAGAELLKARLSASDKMGPGVAVFTKAYGLKKTCGAKNVIHIAGVLWEGGAHDESILIDAAYLKAMAIANALKAEIVTLPVMGAGKFGMPKPMALDQAVKSLKECNRYFPDIEIKLVTVEAEIYDYAKAKYASLCESHFSAEEEAKFRKKFPAPMQSAQRELKSQLIHGDDHGYWQGVKLRDFERASSFCEAMSWLWEMVKGRNNAEFALLVKQMKERAEELGVRYKPVDAGYRIRNGMINSLTELSTQSGVSVSTVKHILVDKKIKSAKKNVIIQLCAAMQVPLPYVKSLLRMCHDDFDSSKRDEAIRRFISNGGGGIGLLRDFLHTESPGERLVYKVKRRKRSSDENARATASRCKKQR